MSTVCSRSSVRRTSTIAVIAICTVLVSTIAVPDLLYQGTLVTGDTYRPLEVYTVVALIYFAMLFPSTLLAQAYERSLAKGR